MTEQPRTLIAVDAGELQALRDEMAALRRAVEAVQMAPRPEWLTIPVYAAKVGRTAKTVRRWINEGSVETRQDGSVTLVRAV